MIRFIKKNKKSQKSAHCPVCDSPVSDINYLYYNNNREYNFYTCDICGFIFAFPALIEDLDNRQMDGINNAEMFNNQFLKRIYTQLIIKREIRLLKKHNSNDTMSTLDIGCGTGWTSSVYAKNGFAITGLEPSGVRADIAKKKYNLPVINDYIENISESKQYNFIILRHIIEHLANPKAIITRLNSFLTNDGIVVIIVPNINCLGRYLFETDWEWVLPWHTSFFSKKSITMLLEKSEFQVLKCYQTPSPLYFTESLLRKINNKKLTAFMKKKPLTMKFISAFFSLIGTAAGMGDNITIIAKRK